MLGRPIIILSEDVVRNKRGEAISYNDIFGIYLPLLKAASECLSQPLVLAYDQSHFCPLINTDEKMSPSMTSSLPLYQSLEHAREQKLLPIKFLENDLSQEGIDQLLRNYLCIQELSYSFKPEHTAVPVLTAELGKANIADKQNFFLLYYDYIKDFFDTQTKLKLQEEESERTLRDQDYYRTLQPMQVTQSRSFSNTENTAAPPSYSSAIGKTEERKHSAVYDRRSSYDKAVENGTLNGSPPGSSRFPNPSSDFTTSYVSTTHVNLKPYHSIQKEARDVHQYENLPGRAPVSSLTTEDLMSHSPVIIHGNSDVRPNQSRLKQGTFALSLVQSLEHDRRTRIALLLTCPCLRFRSDDAATFMSSSGSSLYSTEGCS